MKMVNAGVRPNPPLKPQKVYVEENERPLLDEYRKKYGRHKKLPHGYELQALIALAYYPELCDIRIEFVFVEDSRPFSARPKLTTLFLPAHQRTYVISICKKADSPKDQVLLRNLTFNIQIGQFGHELAHISDYIRKSSLEIVMVGAGYLIPGSKRDLEKGTDLVAIKHGLGYQVLEFAHLIVRLTKEYPKDDFFKTYLDYYMTPSEIETKLKTLKIYQK